MNGWTARIKDWRNYQISLGLGLPYRSTAFTDSSFMTAPILFSSLPREEKGTMCRQARCCRHQFWPHHTVLCFLRHLYYIIPVSQGDVSYHFTASSCPEEKLELKATAEHTQQWGMVGARAVSQSNVKPCVSCSAASCSHIPSYALIL